MILVPLAGYALAVQLCWPQGPLLAAVLRAVLLSLAQRCPLANEHLCVGHWRLLILLRPQLCWHHWHDRC